MARENEQILFIQRLLQRLGRRAVAVVRPQIPSRTLRRALQLRVEAGAGRAELEIPHYWAVYVHDGRGLVRPRRPNVRWLAFYRNPDQDPRRPKQTVRAAQIRPLTEVISRQRFISDARRGKIIFSQKVKATQGVPFFSRGLHAFNRTEAPAIILDEVSEFVCRIAAQEEETRTVRVRMS